MAAMANEDDWWGQREPPPESGWGERERGFFYLGFILIWYYFSFKMVLKFKTKIIFKIEEEEEREVMFGNKTNINPQLIRGFH